MLTVIAVLVDIAMLFFLLELLIRLLELGKLACIELSVHVHESGGNKKIGARNWVLRWCVAGRGGCVSVGCWRREVVVGA